MLDFAADPVRIYPQVADAEILEQKSEQLQIGYQSVRAYIQSGTGDGRIHEITGIGRPDRRL